MAWSTAAPSGVTWTNEKSFRSTKFSYYQVFCTAWSARGSGNTYYVRLRVTYGAGTTGNEYVPQLYLHPDGAASSSSVSYWYYTGSGTGSVTVGLSEFSGYFNTGAASASISIPARWTYSITYNGNGATGGTTSTGTKTDGETYYISANGYTRTGYDFVGWNTDSSATTAQYSPGQAYTTNAALSLYAIWKLKTYAVTYNGNEATGGTTDAQTKTYGVDLALRQNGFVRDKYNFVEWNTAADGTGTSYAAGATYTENAALVLYAIWIKANIPVWINIGGTLHQIEKAYVNVGGVIKEADVYMNVGGEIKAIT